tara:strand:- start:41 stop:502 length:462 start_codon:yes stop_codon:yes gene_type:complete
MAITQAMCTSFKVQLLKGQHNFTNGAHQFKLALFTSAATLGAGTTNFAGGAGSPNFESSGTGYTSGGANLTNVTPTSSSTTAFTSFGTPLTFQSSTITAAGALIYNTETNGSGTPTTDSVIVLNFGGDKSSTNGDFSIVFPTVNASDAIIRIE